MEDLNYYYHIIEEALVRLELDPVLCRGEQKGQWNLAQGSANVWIDLWHIERQGRAYYQVMSPVMYMPQNAEKTVALFQELLELNDKLFGVAFSMYQGLIWMKTIREARGMDVEEALNILTRIATYADLYDDYLIHKYGGTFPDQGPAINAPAPPDDVDFKRPSAN